MSYYSLNNLKRRGFCLLIKCWENLSYSMILSKLMRRKNYIGSRDKNCCLRGITILSFFHRVANGRKRRNTIITLVDGDNTIEDVLTSFFDTRQKDNIEGWRCQFKERRWYTEEGNRSRFGTDRMSQWLMDRSDLRWSRFGRWYFCLLE